MDLVRVLGIGLTGTVLAMSLSRVQGAYGLLVALATGCVLLLLALGQTEELLSSLMRLSEEGGVSSAYVRSLLRVLGLSALTEAGSRLCRDGGQSHIAFQVELCGRVLILYAVLPAAEELLSAGTAMLAALTP